MRFVEALLVGASALATAAAAQNLLINTPANVVANKPVTLTYSAPDLDLSSTITLQYGAPVDLNTILVITADATGGSYVWVPPPYLETGSEYVLMISQGDVNRYSGGFSISGGNTAAIQSAEAATSASLASASSYRASEIGAASSASAVSSLLAELSSVTKGLASATGSSSSNSTNSTATAMTGTGTAMSRNGTMSSATLTGAGAKHSCSGKSSSCSSHNVTQTSTMTGTKSSSKTMKSTAPPSKTAHKAAPPASTSTAAAAAGNFDSSVALIVGAFAALGYL